MSDFYREVVLSMREMKTKSGEISFLSSKMVEIQHKWQLYKAELIHVPRGTKLCNYTKEGKINFYLKFTEGMIFQLLFEG